MQGLGVTEPFAPYLRDPASIPGHSVFSFQRTAKRAISSVRLKAINMGRIDPPSLGV